MTKNIKEVPNNVVSMPKKNKNKKQEKINDNSEDYNSLKHRVDKELIAKYNTLMQEENEKLKTLRENTIDYNLVKIINPKVTPYHKMNLDYMLYKLNHFFQNDLEHTNEVILEIIDKFKEVGIKLSIKDFNYTNYVYTYMSSILNNKGNPKETFESIYWECPDLIIQISLNFRYLYFKYKKDIEKYYKKIINKNEKINYYEAKYNSNYDEIKELEHNDQNFILNQFINNKYNIKDFGPNNINRIKKELILDEKEDIYDNLILLEETLFDYRNYINIEIIANDLKELYQHKKDYKNLKENKLKIIKKLENELFKTNKKLKRKRISKNADENKLKVNNLINALIKNYKELDSISIKDDIYNKVNDQTSLLEYFRLASDNFVYIKELLKIENKNVDIREINLVIKKLKDYLYQKDNSLLTNIKLGIDKNIPRIICDKYKLTNLNITEEKISKQEIDKLIKDVNVLLVNYDLERLGLKISDVSFVLKVNERSSE